MEISLIYSWEKSTDDTTGYFSIASPAASLINHWDAVLSAFGVPAWCRGRVRGPRGKNTKGRTIAKESARACWQRSFRERLTSYSALMVPRGDAHRRLLKETIRWVHLYTTFTFPVRFTYFALNITFVQDFYWTSEKWDEKIWHLLARKTNIIINI